MATVEELYKSFGILADAKDGAGEHKEAYLTILSAVKGGTSEKRLASQFIARFFKYFPDLSEKAIDAQLDLCEDDDISIRKQAIKELPMFCKAIPAHVGRIADILTQLLQCTDEQEHGVVQAALLSLFKTYPKGALGGLFLQILSGEDIVREQAMKFLTTKIPALPEESITKDVEDLLISESKKVLQDVTGDEFILFINFLSSLQSMKSLTGRKELVEIIVEQADLDEPFNAAEPECVNRLIACIRQALGLFSKNVNSNKFVAYMCDYVLSDLSKLKALPVEEIEEEEKKDSEEKEAAKTKEKEDPTVDLQLDVLKLLAEMTTYITELEHIDTRLTKVYNKLLEHMPLPPADDENGENTTPSDEPKLDFSTVECLMYTFHQLARQKPDFLTAEENSDRLKDFRLRLQYFARGCQVYIKQLRAALQGKTSEALRAEENKIKVVALKITSNINTLIKDLFHNPPSYKAQIMLSWKPVNKSSSSSLSPVGHKRSSGITPITYEGQTPNKKSALTAPNRSHNQDRKIYSPPTGKWSDSAGQYLPGGRGRGRGNRGGNRGRGRGRGAYRGNYRW